MLYAFKWANDRAKLINKIGITKEELKEVEERCQESIRAARALGKTCKT